MSVKWNKPAPRTSTISLLVDQEEVAAVFRQSPALLASIIEDSSCIAK